MDVLLTILWIFLGASLVTIAIGIVVAGIPSLFLLFLKCLKDFLSS